MNERTAARSGKSELGGSSQWIIGRFTAWSILLVGIGVTAVEVPIPARCINMGKTLV